MAPLVRLRFEVIRQRIGWSWYLVDAGHRIRFSGWHWDREGAKRAARARRARFEWSLG